MKHKASYSSLSTADVFYERNESMWRGKKRNNKLNIAKGVVIMVGNTSRRIYGIGNRRQPMRLLLELGGHAPTGRNLDNFVGPQIVDTSPAAR